MPKVSIINEANIGDSLILALVIFAVGRGYSSFERILFTVTVMRFAQIVILLGVKSKGKDDLASKITVFASLARLSSLEPWPIYIVPPSAGINWHPLQYTTACKRCVYTQK